MKTKTSRMGNSMNRLPMQLPFLHIPLVLAFACLALAPQARAGCQDGCLTNGNTVLGDDALLNSTGGANTAIGLNALEFNTTGSGNTAIGSVALIENSTGSTNTATGDAALEFNDTGSNNAAYGFDALQINRDGSNNTAVGYEALRSNNASSNTAVGYLSLTRCKGNSNIALGSSAGTNIKQTDNNIDIGNTGVVGDSNTIRIGNETHTATYIAGISGATVPGGVGVIVDSSGHLGTTTSSVRYKENIKPMDKSSEAILALEPVTFRYKHELDPDGIQQFGLVAEQVAKVDPDLVARDEQGKPYTVRYEAVNAMLLNEFLKEHRKNEEQQAIIERQQKQIDALTAGLQKLSAQLAAASPSGGGREVSNPAAKVVLNNP